MARKYKWRLYADADVERGIIEALRKAKMDVLWVGEDESLKRQRDDSFHYQKAREFGRYLLTKDDDFWDDYKHPLGPGPGVIILNAKGDKVGGELVSVLRNLLHYRSDQAPNILVGIKIKLSTEGVQMKFMDATSQKKSLRSWSWRELSAIEVLR